MPGPRILIYNTRYLLAVLGEYLAHLIEERSRRRLLIWMRYGARRTTVLHGLINEYQQGRIAEPEFSNGTGC